MANIPNTMAIITTHLKRVFIGGQKPLIVPPALNESETARLARGMGQGIHYILKVKQYMVLQLSYIAKQAGLKQHTTHTKINKI